MIYAFNPTNGTLCGHHDNRGFFSLKLDGDTGSCTLMNRSERVYATHGWLMWFSWTVIALAQIILNRYRKNWWRKNQLIHNILGIAALVFTITAFIVMMQYKNWKMSFRELNHSKFGLAFIILTLILCIMGIVAILIRR